MLRMALRQDPYAKDAVMRGTWRTSMTTLITGGMGFIGLHTARACLDAGEDVVITYFQTWREPSFIKDDYQKRVQIEQVDVTDRDSLMALGKKHKIDRIAHLAVPGLGALGPVEDLRTNIAGLTHVLEAALEWGSKRLTLASSVAVYAGLPAGPFVEDALLPIASGNPTETFKKAWEILALHFASRTSLEIISMRIGGIWGPLYHSMANLPSRLTHAAVQGTDPELASTRGGVPFAEDSGDMCYVKDCAQGIQLLTLTEKLPHNIYNVGSGRATTNGELLAAVKKAVPTCTLEIKEGRSPRWRQDVYMDISRIKADTGYEPRYTVETGVQDYVAWLRAGNAR
jgi:UDP-glucose 4-epimerase